MFGKNNEDMRKKQMGQKTKTFTLRKLRVGLVSAMIGSCILFGSQVVSANQVEGTEASVTTEVVNPTEKESEDLAEGTLVDAPVAISENTPEVEASPEVAKEETSAESTTETITEKADEAAPLVEPTETSTQALPETGTPVEKTSTEATAEPKVETKEVGNDPSLIMDNLVEDPTFGEKALEHVEYLSETIGSRVVGTEGEKLAQEYVIDQLKQMGYEVITDEFSFERRGTTYTSQNISVVKPGALSQEVILGAHYDSVSSGGSHGADDNASGVGILLEMAQRLNKEFTDYTIRFIAFGAEEVGLQGSKYHVSQMSQEEIDNTLAMINLDSLISGDYKYMYSGLGGKTWVRDQAFDIAEAINIPGMQTNPGLNEEYPYGETGDWSDHAPFNEVGIPVVYFEATNWNIGDLDGYNQTEEFGPIFHTGTDNLDFLNEHFPGRVSSHLYSFSSILYNLLTNITNPDAKIEYITEDIPFETIYEIDDTLTTNEEVVVTEGTKGVLTSKVIDGVIVETQITNLPTNRVIKRRSKPIIIDDKPTKDTSSKPGTKPVKVAASTVGKLPETGTDLSSTGWALFGLAAGLGLMASEKLRTKKTVKK